MATIIVLDEKRFCLDGNEFEERLGQFLQDFLKHDGIIGDAPVCRRLMEKLIQIHNDEPWKLDEIMDVLNGIE
jgi:hypothetical protein